MDEFRVMIKDVVTEQRQTFDPGHIRGYLFHTTYFLLHC